MKKVAINACALAMILSLHATASAQAGNSTNPKVTFSSTGEQVRRVLNELSAQTGATLVVAEALAQEPVVIRAVDVPLDDLVARIATAIGADVVRNGTQIELRPSQKGRSEAEKFAERVAQIRKDQEKVRARIAKKPAFDKEAAKGLMHEIETYFQSLSERKVNDYRAEDEKLGNSGPHVRLSEEIFVAIPAEELALITKQNRVVWCNVPTAKQRRLPNQVIAPVQRFLNAQKIWTETLGGRAFNYPQDRGLPTNIHYLLEKNFEWSMPDPDGDEEANLILISGRSWSGMSADLEIRLVNKRGRYVQTANFASYNLNDDEPRGAGGPDLNVTPDQTIPNIVVPLREDAKAFLQHMQKMMQGGFDRSEPIQNLPIKEKLLNPDKHDPISIVFGPTIIDLAEKGKLNVVASVPDLFAFWSALLFEGDNASLQKLVGKLAGAGQLMKGKVEGGWLTIELNRESSSFTNDPAFFVRSNRRELGKLIRSGHQEGRLSLDALASYATSLPDDARDMDQIVMLYASLLWGQDPGYFGEIDKLRFYGSLDPMQRRASKEGKELPYSGLRPEQKRLLEIMVYSGQNWDLSFQPTEESGDRNVENPWELFHNGLLGEPTYRFARGFASMANLLVTDTVESEIKTSRTGKYGQQSESSSADHLGTILFYQELDDPEYSYYKEMGPISSFELVDTRRVNVRVQLDPEVSYSFQLSEKVRSHGKYDSVEKLPNELYKKVLAAKELARKSYEEMRRHQQPPPGLTKTSYSPGAGLW